MDKSKDIIHILAPYEYKVGFLKSNPLSDKEISDKLNQQSNNVSKPTNSLFLKVLRDVSRQIYQNLQPSNFKLLNNEKYRLSANIALGDIFNILNICFNGIIF